MWLWDFIQMPSRIRKLSEQEVKAQSREMTCPNCKGPTRVGHTNFRDGLDIWRFDCPACEMDFWRSFKP